MVRVRGRRRQVLLQQGEVLGIARARRHLDVEVAALLVGEEVTWLGLGLGSGLGSGLGLGFGLGLGLGLGSGSGLGLEGEEVTRAVQREGRDARLVLQGHSE